MHLQNPLARKPGSAVSSGCCVDRLKPQPTPASDAYTTRIVYTRQQLQPRVYVVTPALTERAGETVPHTYGDGGLCLWQPAYQEWRANYWIAETIIGWTSLWLFFYELWHACGEWLGGGEHPPETDIEMESINERNQRS